MTTNFLPKTERKTLDDILFENRNKEYGAYVLRNEANTILKKSFFIGVSAFSAVLLATYFYLNTKTIDVPVDGPGVEIDLTQLPPDVETPKPETVKVEPPKTDNIKTEVIQIPEPKRDAIIETPVVSQKDLKDAAIGLVKKDGEAPVTNYVPDVAKPGTGTVIPEKPADTFDPSKIAEKVDVSANFSGGIDAFRNQFMQKFDVSQFEGEGEIIRATLTFVVERDGTISNVKAVGPDAAFNKEAERTIQQIKNKWTPAKLNGNVVRSNFKMPVAMNFE